MNGKISKIYVAVPNSRTGGPESLHQLAYYLGKNGYSVYLYYYQEPLKSELTYPQYEKYVRVASKIEDEHQNVIIVPEISSSLLNKYKRMKKVVWFLSLDFHFGYSLKALWERFLKHRNIPTVISWMLHLPFLFVRKHTTKYPYALNLKDMLKQNIYYLYNCEYVRQYLSNANISAKQMHYLCGPIDKTYLSTDKENVIKNKKNIVTYNPKKVDAEIVERVEKAVKDRHFDVEFLAIKSMTTQQVKENLANSKIYMDLGSFPGPERIPREAVSLYCNLITSKSGAAGNNIDVPISEQFKFDVTNLSPEKIAESIIILTEQYEQYVGQYETYREKVKDQIERFETDILEFIELI